MAKRLITERMVMEWARHSTTMEIPADAIVTDLARDKAKSLGVRLKTTEQHPASVENAAVPRLKGDTGKKVAIGSDHGGFTLKTRLKSILESLDYSVVDVGCDSEEAVDYPDYAHAVARLVADGQCHRGIMIDGAGIGSSMAANKVPGIRAALCYDVTSALNSREHNNANVLTLGARLIGETLAEQIVRIWMKTEFAGGRHQARVDKITDVERRYTR